jgi:coenzyme F420-reducing hydrogenase delta subunit
MQTPDLPKITIFYCINSFSETRGALNGIENKAEISFVKMPCSSMVKDVFLLRAFEAGADAVVILVCPEGQCRYLEGNIRAKKRTAWVAKLLDDIGLDGRRLSLHHAESSGGIDIGLIIARVVETLIALGPNPARKA